MYYDVQHLVDLIYLTNYNDCILFKKGIEDVREIC